ARGRRGRVGQGRDLPGMQDAAATTVVQRDPEAFADPLLPELPARAVLRGAGGRENHLIECGTRRGFRTSLGRGDPCTNVNVNERTDVVPVRKLLGADGS